MEEDDTTVEARMLLRLEEAVWVAQAQSGDAGAFVLLMKRHERPLLYYLRRLVPKGDGALDIHQEVWLDVFRGLSSLQVPEAFRVWIYRIAHHKAARFVRNEIRHEELTESLTDDEPAGFAAEELNAEIVHKALEILPAHHREILTLHYLNDLSTAEVGRVLDCPQGTVKSRLHHARIALRRVIKRKNL
jgi:RNA polymerase sigma-70 factor, ECF subfamily